MEYQNEPPPSSHIVHPSPDRPLHGESRRPRAASWPMGVGRGSSIGSKDSQNHVPAERLKAAKAPLSPRNQPGSKHPTPGWKKFGPRPQGGGMGQTASSPKAKPVPTPPVAHEHDHDHGHDVYINTSILHETKQRLRVIWRVANKERVLGLIDVSECSSLSDVRRLAVSELDGLPQSFVFVEGDAPIGRKQEHKRRAFDYFPEIFLVSVSSDSSSNNNNDSINDLKSKQGEMHQRGRSHNRSSSIPRVSVMFSCPLAYLGDDNKLRAMPVVDYEAERELICRTFEEARLAPAIHLSFGFATTDYLRSVVTMGCDVLHYSGHANPNLVSFEDGYAGVHFVHCSQLNNLFAAGGYNGKPELCFVSACSSRAAGQAFVDAGVPHVVAVEEDAEIIDRAARHFTRSFYLALVQGRTVRESFEIASETVRASPNISPTEAQKFVLLPKEGHHDRRIFLCKECNDDLAQGQADDKLDAACSMHVSGLRRQHRHHRRFKRPPPLSCDSLPAVPEPFVGRNVEMYRLITTVLRHRLVTLCGGRGYGKTAMSIATAKHLSERRHFRDGVHFVGARGATTAHYHRNYRRAHASHNDDDQQPLSAADIVAFMSTVRAKPAEPAEPAGAECGSEGASIASDQRRCSGNSMFDCLQRLQCLIVIDNPDVESSELRLLLAHILEQARGVKILLTASHSLSENGFFNFSVAEKVQELEPLDSHSAALLLVSRSPRRIEPEEFGAKSKEQLLELLADQPALSKVPGHICAIAPMLRSMELHEALTSQENLELLKEASHARILGGGRVCKSSSWRSTSGKSSSGKSSSGKSKIRNHKKGA